ncbi:hypothetical protein GCM10007860_03910 [Chitiniphilus shinanonensis]|uniref:Uncharacterized protein n=1 Tax=Chitiniphilus shinanonensis TaxID=553088 RepID=A0ABQ6BMV7_9NEIS|nr:hypothetical protein GCM10007860_03910 [Chitiniphilus shinanonensis]
MPDRFPARRCREKVLNRLLVDETAVERGRCDDPSARERGEGNYVASDPTVSEQRQRQRRDASDDLGV